MRFVVLLSCTLLATSALARGAEPVDNEYFEKKVRPILATNCVECHDAKKQKGGLRLDAKAEFAKGGESGAAVVPGKPEKSRLIDAIGYAGEIKMPPKGKLSDADIATLTEWVKGGAPWPNDGAAATGPKDKFDLHARAKAHWSFAPIKRPAVPDALKHKGQVTNPIDNFLLAKLDAAGLTFSSPAEKRVLLRRVYFDLIGLPPSPAEIDAFLKDDAPDAYAKVVDKLLATSAVRRALGPPLARPRALRRDARPRVRLRHSRRVAVPRLRHPRAQRRPAVRPVPHRAHRGRSAAAAA